MAKTLNQILEFTSSQMAVLKKEYGPLKGKTLSRDQWKKMETMLGRFDNARLKQLADSDIPMLSTAAKSELVIKRKAYKWNDFRKPLDMDYNPEEIDESMIGNVKKAVEIAKKMAGNMTAAVKEIETLQKGLSKHIRVKDALRLANEEADLSKSQIKKVHKQADELPKQDFIKRYGKDGDAVRYATATNQVKKKLGIDEQRAHTSPEVAAAIRQYVAQRPLLWRGDVGKADKKDFEELMRLALKDMKAFNKKFNSMDTDPRDGVRQALMKKGLQSHITDETEPKGDKQMQEQSYKDKFNATMKDFGINSLDDLKSDEDKKKFFTAVDKKHDAIDEALEVKWDANKQGWFDKQGKRRYLGKGATTDLMHKAIDKAKKTGDWVKSFDLKHGQLPEEHNCEKEHPTKSHADWKQDQKEGAMKRGSNLDTFKPKPKEETEVKKEMKDLEPDAEKLNAMVKDPHKSKEDKAKKDMISAQSDSDVRPDVKNGGGADMAKVKDAPKMQTAMKKINAMYKTEKYFDEKPGSIQNTVAKMFQAENKMVTVEDKKLDDMIKTYLAKGGTITKLPPALQKGAKPSDMTKHKIGNKGVVKSMYKMGEVREFVTTYNLHFLTNFKAEELILRDRLQG